MLPDFGEILHLRVTRRPLNSRTAVIYGRRLICSAQTLRPGLAAPASTRQPRERKGEASKTLNIYFCLCVIKEILAITGVFFLPGMKQKWKINSTKSGFRLKMHAEKNKNKKAWGPADEPQSLSGPRSAEIILPGVRRPRVKMSPLPTLSPSPLCGTPSVFSIYWQL